MSEDIDKATNTLSDTTLELESVILQYQRAETKLGGAVTTFLGGISDLNFYYTEKMPEFVLDCMRENTTKIRNIKQYLKAVLFNAPSTIDSYYTALVNHDFYGSK